MSDINDDSRRTRRRAVRTAGPPVEDTEAATVTVSAADPGGSEEAATESAPVSGTEAKKSAAEAQASAVDGGADAQPRTAADETASARKTPAEPAVGADESDEPPTVLLSKSADADATRAAGETAGEQASDEKPDAAGYSLRGIVLAAAAAVLIAALLAGAVVSVFTVRSIDRQAERRTEYVQTAEQTILNLTTINADTAKEDIDRILSLASGKFKTEFDGRVDPFLSIVQQAEVRATGEIVEAALESEEGDSGKVLVAAKQTLTNAGQEGPQTRNYRFRVTVSESDSGLTASNVEFVP
ncbi:hypothetical protein [Nocardia higoensis]|uniref:hypothetical protein n=1 Tax=Nocardia higoensis TaxID=228599 RepID=UPI0012F6AA46|nr:hypothetical protein [Nocardia higoensis]